MDSNPLHIVRGCMREVYSFRRVSLDRLQLNQSQNCILQGLEFRFEDSYVKVMICLIMLYCLSRYLFDMQTMMNKQVENYSHDMFK